MNEIKWDKDIYSESVIRLTAKEFRNLCKVDIQETKDSFICCFHSLSAIQEELVISEFENYMIDYINSEKLYADN